MVRTAPNHPIDRGLERYNRRQKLLVQRSGEALAENFKVLDMDESADREVVTGILDKHYQHNDTEVLRLEGSEAHAASGDSEIVLLPKGAFGREELADLRGGEYTVVVDAHYLKQHPDSLMDSLGDNKLLVVNNHEHESSADEA